MKKTSQRHECRRGLWGLTIMTLAMLAAVAAGSGVAA